MTEALISVRDLSIRYGGPTGPAAVDGVSFDVNPGEIVALVGESGSGKSSVSLAIMSLLPDSAHVGGHILFEGHDLAACGRREMEDIRGNRIGMIFQEPMTCLNPVLSIARQMTEGLVRHRAMSRSAARIRALQALADVGIPEPERVMSSFPHELSGGMRQRVMIAAALTLEPSLLIADEPTTALDVTVQAQVLDLLVEIRNRTGDGVLLITHDIGVVAEVADRVVVMQGGRVVEHGPWEQVIRTPREAYTKALIGAHMSLEEALTEGGLHG
ncbi:ATP-binding cassette domain-containing protein [Salipiger bermudensis]|uniref:ATP-binding cassette domain-containing protein n=1 Tax=Salipiger bermudensis TaxID=344736 RepID=UPI001CD2A772|nr:ABC transporter ATP-binding protein [Salipiger bermudensis]MCA1287704.1 ABC transporter ATP-binding protein [Salipiger bermudensis]